MYRRSFQRFIFDNSGFFITKEGEEQYFILTDLSVIGAGIAIDKPLNIGDFVTVIIDNPSFFEAVIRKKGKIVWCRKINDTLWRAGVDFGLDNKIKFFPSRLKYIS